MCVYDGDNAEWFEAAVESILTQTVKPSEVVLVVDGFVSEELDSVIKKYEQIEGFRVIRLEKNQGHGHARRVGLEACVNEYVALMDADDISIPERFEKQLNIFISDPTVDIVGGNITEFVENPECVVSVREVPSTNEEIKTYMKDRCPMNQVTVMFKKSSVEEVGGYIDWFCNEDYYLWIRMALAGMKFSNLKDILVNVRISDDSYQRRGGWKYFISEFKLQNYMLKNRVIGFGQYLINVLKRFIVQVLLPNKIRGWAFKKFARKEYAYVEKNI